MGERDVKRYFVEDDIDILRNELLKKMFWASKNVALYAAAKGNKKALRAAGIFQRNVRRYLANNDI